jgi:riboflavin synthase|tara:strand:- start:872 stop:1456 length:585 start_codon:yes stop_codon:yes gene_type:complete
MFTGIIENIGLLVDIQIEEENIHFTIQSILANELKVDQSVAHNGVCLTVVKQWKDMYMVTAVKETLEVSNLSNLRLGQKVNLERCMQINGRLDGHIVQGHVDDTAVCTVKESNEGSWRFIFGYSASRNKLIVEKGSICINGVSLTAFNVTDTSFEVAIIPFTYEHTGFQDLVTGDHVNLEFDIIGKYIARLQEV